MLSAQPDMFVEALDLLMMMGGTVAGLGRALDVPHGALYASHLSPQVSEGGGEAGGGSVGIRNPWRDSIGFSESAMGEVNTKLVVCDQNNAVRNNNNT
jgi:hypothetical protein